MARPADKPMALATPPRRPAHGACRAVGPAGRLRCDARVGVAPPNSLRSPAVRCARTTAASQLTKRADARRPRRCASRRPRRPRGRACVAAWGIGWRCTLLGQSAQPLSRNRSSSPRCTGCWASSCSRSAPSTSSTASNSACWRAVPLKRWLVTAAIEKLTPGWRCA
jgi:hypothetical protein